MSPISRYKVIDQISEEHTTEIYKALDTCTNEIVVIKWPKRGCRQTANEINILSNLRHKHILPLRDVINTRFGPAPVYQFAAGGDLLSVIEKVSLDEREVKTIMFQMLDALLYLHRHSIVHGDIRPENIVLIQDGTVSITDFGLAAFGGSFYDDRGSKYYAAPELLAGKGKSAKSDVWAAGLTMFACLTGTFPFDCTSEEVMAAEIAEGLPDLLKQKSLASLSPDGKDLLRRLLLRDVGRRANCEEALAHRWFADCHCRNPYL